MSSKSGLSTNPVQSFGGLLSSSSSQVGGGVVPTVDVAAATASLVLSPSQSGTTFFLQPSVALAITLPAVAANAGVKYTFIQKSGAAANWTITAPAGTLSGLVVGANTFVACSSAGAIASAFANILEGDKVELICSGVDWFVDARGYTAGCFTVA